MIYTPAVGQISDYSPGHLRTALLVLALQGDSAPD